MVVRERYPKEWDTDDHWGKFKDMVKEVEEPERVTAWKDAVKKQYSLYITAKPSRLPKAKAEVSKAGKKGGKK